MVEQEYDYYQVSTYIDTRGATVRVAVSQINGKTVYTGMVVIQVVVQTPAGSTPHEMPVEFDIGATSVKDAFDKFDGAAKARVEEIREEQQKKSILQATSIPMPGNLLRGRFGDKR
jgi:hypothetical protein